METKKSSKDKIKEAVKERYAGAITKQGSACCGKGPVETVAPEKVLSMAGYRHEDLEQVPPAALQSSMGCGNPLAFAEVLPGQTVLDLGSGAGLDCFIAAEKVGPQGKVYGLDMTPEMIAQAEKNAQEGGFANVEFLLGEMESIPLPDASVDWVISNCVVNLSPDKPKVFKEIARVLRPGGRIAISDIVVQDMPSLLRQNMETWSACVGGSISEEEYVKGLEEAGLKEVKVTSRYVYSQKEMEGFLYGQEEIEGFLKEVLCCSGTPLEKAGEFRKFMEQLESKVWSARFEGIK